MLNASYLFDLIIAKGGATLSLEGFEPATGFAVAVAPDRTSIAPLISSDRNTVAAWISRNLEFLSRSEHYVGAWIDSGELYLDIVKVYSDRSAAVAAGRKFEQLAIFDLGTFDTIWLASEPT